MYILLTGNLPYLSRVRRKQQIKERPEQVERRVGESEVCGYCSSVKLSKASVDEEVLSKILIVLMILWRKIK